MTLLYTAVETAISSVYKLLCTGGVLLNIVALTMADGVFGLHGSERFGRAIPFYPIHSFPRP